MVDTTETKRIATTLPGVTDNSGDGRLIFSLGDKGVAWSFMQRDTPKQKRWPNIEVLAISCTLEQKELLIEAAPGIYFDDPHYRGYPAVLTRLPMIDADELEHRLREGVAFQMSRPKKRKR